MASLDCDPKECVAYPVCGVPLYTEKCMQFLKGIEAKGVMANGKLKQSTQDTHKPRNVSFGRCCEHHKQAGLCEECRGKQSTKE